MALCPERQKRFTSTQRKAQIRKDLLVRLDNPKTIISLQELIIKKRHPDEIHSLLGTHGLVEKRVLADLTREKHEMDLKIEAHAREIDEISGKAEEMKRKLKQDRKRAYEEKNRPEMISTTKQLIELNEAISRNDYSELYKLIK